MNPFLLPHFYPHAEMLCVSVSQTQLTQLWLEDPESISTDSVSHLASMHPSLEWGGG